MSGSAAGERDVIGAQIVLPRRSYAWRAVHGYLLLAILVVIAAFSWAVDEGAVLGPLVLVVLGVGAWVGFVWWFRRDADSYRLVIDAQGVASLRHGEIVESTAWARMTYVDFDSGARWSNWTFYGGNLGTVRCHDDRAYDRWNPNDVGVQVDLPVFGRRGLRAVDDALRNACGDHGIEYRSHWRWSWLIGLTPRNWRRTT